MRMLSSQFIQYVRRGLTPNWVRTKRPFIASGEKKRGEAAPELSGVLIVQFDLVTEDPNRRWYKQNSGRRVSDIQRRATHWTIPWIAAALDALVKETGVIF
jgi:hypothetical protein